MWKITRLFFCLVGSLGALILILLLTFGKTAASGKTLFNGPIKTTESHYYVDDDGNNDTGDGSQANPWKTISYALTQVSGPDVTIHVSPGTYDTVMGGGWAEVFPISMQEGVSLVGAGADVAILDAGQSAAAIKAEGIGSGERIAGFTIRNGYWPGDNHGGGFYIVNSSPIVEDNVITNNDAGATGNVFHSGGGIYVESGSPTIRNNTISDNGSTELTSACGGGIYVTGATSAPLIQGNVISNNRVWIGGAGIYVENSSAPSIIEANLITNNNQASDQWVDHQESAGGIALYSSLAVVRNNTIAGNTHTGLNLYDSASSGACVVNNTIVGNTWHGISLYSASPTIANNLLVGNNDYGINEEDASADPAVSYNLFHNNGAGVYYDEGETSHLNTTTLNGLVEQAHDNLDGDPAFVAQSSGDYHLTTDSPAINAGDNNAPSLPDTDFDGDPRIMDGVIDIGADEYPVPVAPLTGVTISGPTTGMVNTPYTFTATVSPITATQPITYAWQATGQGAATHVVYDWSDTVDFTWPTTGTHIITITVSNVEDVVTDVHAITIVASSTDGDTYEPDDACAQASALTADGAAQLHTFHQHADEDWVRFTVVSGTIYVLQAASTSPDADMILELYDACAGNLSGSDDNAFGADALILFTAPSSGVYYARALNHDPGAYGVDVSYELSVRAQVQDSIVLIVAGNDDGYHLQDNILYAANLAYRTFLNAGIPKDHIRYLSAVDDDDRTDADGDGSSDVYASSASANVEAAITTWAASLADGDTPFYVYMIDHGGVDAFLAHGSGDTITPAELDGWLNTLEAATGALVNVIYEACHSGSFIDGLQEISQVGRVIMASTGRVNNAYAAAGRGAYFSDALFTALGQSLDLHTSFQWGVAAVEATGLWQTPWLDDDGDGAPNTTSDGQEARRRGLVPPPGLAERPPVVDAVLTPTHISSSWGILRAQARDDTGIARVWVEVYPPSFVEPEPAPDGTTPDLGLPQVELSDSDGDGWYTGVYEGFVEAGLYRLVVYAEDSAGNLSQPAALEVRRWMVYLPVIVKQ